MNRTKIEIKDLHDQRETEVRRDDESGVNERVKKQDVVPHFALHGVYELPDCFDCGKKLSTGQMVYDHVFNLASVISYIYFLCRSSNYSNMVYAIVIRLV